MPKGTNKSVGNAILLSKKFFALDQIMDVKTTSGEIAGRGLFVRIRAGRIDYSIICAYFPPGRHSSGAERNVYLRQVAALNKWIFQTLNATPARSTPLIFTDLNDDGGLTKCENGDFTPTALIEEDNTVGMVAACREGEAFRAFRCSLRRLGLCLANTHFPAGDTFVGHKATSRFDFIAIPVGLLANVTQCATLKKLASKLQLINCHGLRDHIPLMCKLTQAFMFDGEKAKAMYNWDREK